MRRLRAVLLLPGGAVMRPFHLNRRIHLYLGLLLSPWFLMYGLSSIPFSHARFFQDRDRASGQSDWIERLRRSYEADIPSTGSLRPVGEKIMRDLGLSGAFGTYRQGADQVNVYVYSFWHSTQVGYNTRTRTLVVQDRRFRWHEFLTGMHAKGGFEQGSLHNAWGWVVDAVCIAMLLWVVTGIVMWVRLNSGRVWGWAALAGGLVSFVLFMWTL
jgi:hypothetical protein